MDQEIHRIERERKRLWTAAVVVFVGGLSSCLLVILVPGIPSLFISVPIALCALGFCFWLMMRSGPRVPYRHFEIAREILSALRDDAARVVGLLDLTRPDESSKAVRPARSGGGKRKVYYRDSWLQLKLSLVDGNLLRFSMVDKVKTKAGSVVRRNSKVAVKLAINADLYKWKEAPPEGRVAGYEVSSGSDQIRLARNKFGKTDLSVEQMLSTVQMLYSYLELVGQAAVPGG